MRARDEMSMREAVARRLAMLALACAVVACQGGPEASAPASPAGGKPTLDHLATILARGTLLAYAELNYPPQSILVEGAVRSSGTKCQSDQLTAAEVTGYDVETSKLVAAGLGVEPCFVVFPFEELNAANWGDRIDIGFSSGSINADRMTRMWMTQPYYSSPNSYFVREDSPYQVAAELSGKKVGSCAGCTHEAYLKRELEIPGVTLEFEIDNPTLVTYQTEAPGLQAVVDGEIEAFLSAEPVGQALIDQGLALRALAKPPFLIYPSGWLDKRSRYTQRALFDRVNDIVRDLHAGGRLKALSETWFKTDYATPAAAFDIDAVGQQVP